MRSVEQGLIGRLRTVLRNATTPVNTPLADALASALEIDIRLNDVADGQAKLEALSDVELRKLGSALKYALKHGGGLMHGVKINSDFHLPLGAKVKVVWPGGIFVEQHCLVQDVGRPGLFPKELTSPDAQGPNYALLCGEIERLTRKLKCRCIGMPSAVKHSQHEPPLFLQFPPFEEAGGVVLQRWRDDTGAALFCAATPKQIREVARDIVGEMQMLWSERRQIAAQVQVARDAAVVAVEAVKTGASVCSIGIDLQHQRDLSFFTLSISYNGIDDAMRPGIVVKFVKTDRDGDFHFGKTPKGIDQAYALRAIARGEGADGWIDDLALAVMHAAPGGASSVRASLASSYEAVMRIPTENNFLYAQLFWSDGCIRASFSVPAQLSFSGGELELLGVSLPQSVLQGLPGKPVNSVVEFPFDCPGIIERAKETVDGDLLINLDLQEQLIDLKSGRTWQGQEREI